MITIPMWIFVSLVIIDATAGFYVGRNIGRKAIMIVCTSHGSCRCNIRRFFTPEDRRLGVDLSCELAAPFQVKVIAVCECCGQAITPSEGMIQAVKQMCD